MSPRRPSSTDCGWRRLRSMLSARKRRPAPRGPLWSFSTRNGKAIACPKATAGESPPKHTGGRGAEVSANVFDTLIASDALGNLVPQLCEKWEVLEGGKTFLLTIRRGVRFSAGE